MAAAAALVVQAVEQLFVLKKKTHLVAPQNWRGCKRSCSFFVSYK
jgi:hypothetical protein